MNLIVILYGLAYSYIQLNKQKDLFDLENLQDHFNSKTSSRRATRLVIAKSNMSDNKSHSPLNVINITKIFVLNFTFLYLQIHLQRYFTLMLIKAPNVDHCAVMIYECSRNHKPQEAKVFFAVHFGQKIRFPHA